MYEITMDVRTKRMGRTLRPNVFFTCLVCYLPIAKYLEPAKLRGTKYKNLFCSLACSKVRRRCGTEYPPARFPKAEKGTGEYGGGASKL